MKKFLFGAGIAAIVAGAMTALSATREDDMCICELTTDIECDCDCCTDEPEASK